MTRHLIYNWYGSIRCKPIETETARMYTTVAGPMLKSSTDIICTAPDKATAESLIERIKPIEAALRQAQRVADEECRAKCMVARKVRDAAIREITGG